LQPINADIRLGKFVLKGKCTRNSASAILPSASTSTKKTSSASGNSYSLLLALFAGLFA
jgi:hypothetical protein